MFFRRLFRQIKDGFVGFGRHIGMALSSSSAVTITLLLVGIFLVLSLNLNETTKTIEDSISLSALVSYDVDSDAAIANIKKQIENIDGVGDVEYRTKDEEFDYYVEMYPDVKEFNELYRDQNPFHDAFLVGVSDTSMIASIKDKLVKINGIDSVYDGGSNTYLLVDIIQKVRIVGFALVLALCILAVYLIYNTIKITIASRENEIWIMRNVGARNSYIRVPFMVEGIIIGLVGSIIPIAGLCFGYYYLYQYCDGTLLSVFELIRPYPFLIYLGLGILGTGIIVGYFGSFISVTKYLRGKR